MVCPEDPPKNNQQLSYLVKLPTTLATSFGFHYFHSFGVTMSTLEKSAFLCFRNDANIHPDWINIFWFFLLLLHSMKPEKTEGSKDIITVEKPTASWVVMVNQEDRTLTVFPPKWRKRRKSQTKTSANRPCCKLFGRACLERNLR